MSRLCLIIFSLTAFVIITLAQTKTKPLSTKSSFTKKEEILTNKAIVDLVKAGLDNSVIVSKIESSTCKFDVTTDGLISLKKDEVSSDIIKAMLDKSSSKPKQTENTNPTRMGNQQVSSQGVAPVPDILSEVNYFDHKTNSAKPLEKQKASLTIKGIMANNYSFELDNVASPFRISSADSITFLVSMSDAMGEPNNWFTLYKLDIKKNKRSATWVNSLAMGKSATKNIVDFKSKKAGSSAFEMIPSQKLEKGEYLFLAKGTMGNYAGRAADVFAFGVD